jgi:photosystem II stability/assembly factor-like uncharacterized protein
LIASDRTALYRSDSGGKAWSWIARVSEPRALVVDGDRVWVGDKRGLLVCERGGWTCRRPGLPAGAGDRTEVSALALSSTSPRAYVGVHHGGAYETRDGGTTWRAMTETLMSAPPALDAKGELHVHAVSTAGDEVFLGTSAGLFQATGPAAWEPAGFPGRDVHALAMDRDLTVWAAVAGPEEEHAPSEVFASRDAGLTWTAIQFPEPVGHELRLMASADAAGALVVTGHALYAATSDGRAVPATPPAATGDMHLAVAARTGGGAVVASRGTLLESRDLASWERLAEPAPTASGTVELGKVLTDLHTGAFFGGALWIVYDLAALALLLFVATGLHLWLAPILRKREKRRSAAASGPAKNAPIRAGEPKPSLSA